MLNQEVAEALDRFCENKDMMAILNKYEASERVERDEMYIFVETLLSMLPSEAAEKLLMRGSRILVSDG